MGKLTEEEHRILVLSVSDESQNMEPSPTSLSESPPSLSPLIFITNETLPDPTQIHQSIISSPPFLDFNFEDFTDFQ
jgi:hypothetical protein